MNIIGRVDKIDFPEIGFENIECKIDTGADNNSFHCANVRVIEKDGETLLKFRLLDKEHPLYQNETITVKEFTEKKIKSSNGITELRYVVKMTIRLFGKRYKANFTLADRSNMTYPILLGRKFLRKKFLVDVSQKDLSFKSKK